MANQPKKYKKFVATAATATLVASAIVPVASAASFSDVADSNSHAEAINALVEAGIIKGYEDGTFKPNATLTRGHVVKMLGKWVETQGFEIPADYDKVARFTDLAVDAADQELVKYAALVKDTGVFNGLADGSLNAKGDITRENMALTLDRAYKAVFGKTLVELAEDVEDLTVTDLATAKAEARETIQALRDLGISNVDTFNPKDTVKRGQFASFLYRTINVADAAAKLKVESVTAVNGTLTVKLAEKAEKVEVKDFTVTQAINGGEAKEVTPSKAELAEDGLTVTLTVPEVAVDATADQSVVYTVNKVAAPAFVVAATPKVESVSAINANQIELKFNQEVDKATAEQISNYTVKKSGTDLLDGAAGVGEGRAVLQEDGKTVVLTLEQAYGTVADINQETVEVSIKNVKVADSETVFPEIKAQKVKVEDTTIPTIKEVKQVSPKEFDVVFSEPVTAASKATLTSAFSINKGSYSFDAKTAVDDKKLATNVVRITTNSKLADGEYTLNVNNGIVDYAGFKVVKQDVVFKAEKDTTDVTATVTKAVGKQVYVEFNKPVTNFADSNVQYHLDYNNEALAGTATQDPSNEKAIIVTFKSDVLPGSHNLKISYKDEKGKQIQDAYDNKFAATSINFSVGADTVAPTATASFDKASGKIEVKFSEAVKGATDKSAYELKDENGKVVTINRVTLKPNTNDLVYVIDTAKLEGNYTLKIKENKITDVSVEQNKLAEVTLNVGIADATAPTVLAATYGGANGEKIHIQFSEGMRTEGEGSVLDKSLYTIGVKNLKDIEDATLTLGNDNKSVIITLPKAHVESEEIVVGRVADATGNFGAYSTSKTATSDTAVKVLEAGTDFADDNLNSDAKVVLTAKDTVEFYVAGHVANVNGSLIKFEGKTPDSISTSHVVLDNADESGKLAATKIVAKFEKNTFGTKVKAGNLTIDAKAITTQLGSSTAELNGGLPLNTDNFADQAAPEVVSLDDTKLDVVAMDLFNNTNFDNGFDFTDISAPVAKDGNIDTIRIQMSEDIAASTLSTTTFTVDGFKVIAAYVDGTKDVQGDTTSVNGEWINLIVQPTTAEGTGVEPKVTLKSSLTDVAGNAITSIDTKALDWADAQVKSQELSTDKKTVILTLTEDVKVATDKDLKTAVTVAGKTVENAELVDGNKLVVTLTEAFVNSDKISVAKETLIEVASSTNNSGTILYSVTVQ